MYELAFVFEGMSNYEILQSSKQYYSLTWFLSPVLGYVPPLIGSASDRCTLRWGRRRPFILALCRQLMGVALFLDGSLIGLSLGDEQGRQPIGIVLTVLGVVVLDFCADATEGPIRAYLLDVADTEEQDMALNIHAASAVDSGSSEDWTGPLPSSGKVFKSQGQILFFLRHPLLTSLWCYISSASREQQYSPQHDRLDQVKSDSVLAMAGGRLDHLDPRPRCSCATSSRPSSMTPLTVPRLTAHHARPS
ncbi:solute carrier family 45 member 4 [Lates japonicus]|uniref:Solute carrier family 45 member 4 n=1 Tax=Lates japonicus TaxID=270547 RepID=A0AAD3R8L2_LATJO|nr:solute carrier family 45 member 4 [Lates japonicus]